MKGEQFKIGIEVIPKVGPMVGKVGRVIEIKEGQTVGGTFPVGRLIVQFRDGTIGSFAPQSLTFIDELYFAYGAPSP